MALKNSTVKVTQLKYGNTKCYLLGGTSKSLLIDTDWAGKLPAFYHALGQKKLTAQGIDYLIITHYHPDHMGIAADLMRIGIRLIVMDCQQNTSIKVTISSIRKIIQRFSQSMIIKLG